MGSPGLSDFIPRVPGSSAQMFSRGASRAAFQGPRPVPGGGNARAGTTWQGLASTWPGRGRRGLGRWAGGRDAQGPLLCARPAEGRAFFPTPGSPRNRGTIHFPLQPGKLRPREVRSRLRAQQAGFELSLEGWERPGRLKEGCVSGRGAAGAKAARTHGLQKEARQVASAQDTGFHLPKDSGGRAGHLGSREVAVQCLLERF